MIETIRSENNDGSLENEQTEMATSHDLIMTINSLNVGVVVVDKDLHVELINDAFHQIWNTSIEILRPGDPFRKLMDVNRDNGVYNVSDSDWETYVESRTSEISAGNVEPRELERSDGVSMIYAVTNLSHDRRLISYIDNTVQKQREHELEFAIQRAEQNERAKSEFLANMSHEIRTPMNGVMGMAELLIKTELSAKQQMFADVIIKSGSSLLTVINDILDFAKIDAGNLDLFPAPFNIAEAIEDIGVLASAAAAEKDIELIVRISPNLPTTMVGDAARFRQILKNLVGNAVKFTEAGHVYVNIDFAIATQSESPAADIKVTIEDTGIGIPPEQLDNIFEKFSQVDTSATREHEGTGLGLSIASSLVKLMGGQIQVESTPDVGSSFSFSITLPIENTLAKKETVNLNDENSRILIVDDNGVNQSILKEQMASWNYESVAVSSGRQAIAFLQQAHKCNLVIDLVILDVQMPKMSGDEVLEIIRTDVNLKNTPVLVLSSIDSSKIHKRLNELGVQGSLIKPARTSILSKTIKTIVSESREKAFETLSKKEDLEEAPTSSEGSEVVIRLTNHLPDDTPIELDVLVVEDNVVNAMMLERSLEKLGMRFDIVRTGKEAYETYLTNAPKMVLISRSLKNTSLSDLINSFREYDSDTGKSKCQIIAMTAHNINKTSNDDLESVLDGQLIKPISPDALKQKVFESLGIENLSAQA